MLVLKGLYAQAQLRIPNDVGREKIFGKVSWINFIALPALFWKNIQQLLHGGWNKEGLLQCICCE